MSRIIPTRMIARLDGDFVVFLIGMRFNQPLRVDKWLPIFLSMPRMLRSLGQHPELGLLRTQAWFGRTTLTRVCCRGRTPNRS